MQDYGLVSSGSEYVQVVGSFKNNNDVPVCTKCGEFHEKQ